MEWQRGATFCLLALSNTLEEVSNDFIHLLNLNAICAS